MTLFDWQRTPPPDWVRDLEGISPPSVRLGHAELWWEAGFPWAPVQRWVIYQLIPRTAMSRRNWTDWAELLDLEAPCQCAYTWVKGAICSRCLAPWPCDCGAHTEAEAIRCPHCNRVRSQGRSNLMAAFLRGYQAFPLWILQGENGGHKLRYTDSERQVAELLGMSGTPPIPGSLPYAGWDQRVRTNLLRYDLAQRRFASLKGARKEEREQLARAARAAQEAYLTGVIDRAKDETPVTAFDDLPRSERRPVDDAEVSARYIETGRLTPRS